MRLELTGFGSKKAASYVTERHRPFRPSQPMARPGSQIKIRSPALQTGCGGGRDTDVAGIEKTREEKKEMGREGEEDYRKNSKFKSKKRAPLLPVCRFSRERDRKDLKFEQVKKKKNNTQTFWPFSFNSQYYSISL